MAEYWGYIAVCVAEKDAEEQFSEDMLYNCGLCITVVLSFSAIRLLFKVMRMLVYICVYIYLYISNL